MPSLRPRKAGAVESSRRTQYQEEETLHKADPPISQLQWLKLGLKSRKHEKKGWLKDLLIAEGYLRNDKTMIWSRVLSDHRCQLAAIEGMREVMGDDFRDPREYRGTSAKGSGGRFVSMKIPSQQGIPKNVYTIPFLLYAYDVSRTTFQNRWKSSLAGQVNEGGSKHTPPHSAKGKHVIDDRDFARSIYTARYFYQHEAIKRKDRGTDFSSGEFKARMKYHGIKFDGLVKKGGDTSRWERQAREHDARQPYIKDDLVEALKANVCRSYRALAKVIGDWCSPNTIERWLADHPSYHLYKKNIKPGLTPENREKQVSFSKHVHNRWGLPAGTKVLWVMSDEKWFHSLVPRSNAKACKDLGIPVQSYSAHHKRNIKKVMVHCTVGYCFTDDPESGGEGFLIGCHRCAAFKIPQRDVRYSSKDPQTGRITFRGNRIKHKKGEPYLIDCNITGSDPGTPTDPKFPLQKLWEHTLFHCIENLVCPGGPCEGAQVVFQEDNAGPHCEGTYRVWMLEEFAKRNWKIELQAPQGPYTNVLDLYLFPGMSHRHSEIVQLYNSTEASIERTWKSVLDVWKTTSSAEVARSFVLAYRIMRLIIEQNGNNAWLSEGTPHCNVRQDYVDTHKGIKQRRVMSIDV